MITYLVTTWKTHQLIKLHKAANLSERRMSSGNSTSFSKQWCDSMGNCNNAQSYCSAAVCTLLNNSTGRVCFNFTSRRSKHHSLVCNLWLWLFLHCPSVDIQSNYKIINQTNIKLSNCLNNRFIIAFEQLRWICLG